MSHHYKIKTLEWRKEYYDDENYNIVADSINGEISHCIQIDGDLFYVLSFGPSTVDANPYPITEFKTLAAAKHFCQRMHIKSLEKHLEKQ